ncbi:hypothetical protein MICPUN_65031 [Micromonas commoda]|uniref:Uncharacterized protein n=1 Tax=Micromonas commoda (strain RCC299 / NOUM17 / CCMP2709) TaxID=296587 RepID=C1EJR0_MICCC|nr:hypothetical protein MICPUN_65031 [Micromonas commoda]ACO68233.1 hypothetical protein MICPUN_65031 [Micromonas commoda]|eukprot:XP_002506975.1 hypothetical protein MICPUN_65031 [Micromonas commoda]
MADSSEIQSKPDAEIQQSKRDQQDSSFLETLVPIPDFFFNIKAEIEPIGGSKWRIRIFGYILYFITLCVMFGSFAYYSLPAQRVSLESIVTSEWQKPGFVCKPLQKTALHGLSTDWSFDECVSATSSPSAESIVSVQKNDGSTQFDFRFAAKDGSTGTLSFYDIWNAKSVETTTWEKEGFECRPLQKTALHGLSTDWSFDECVKNVNVPDATSVKSVTKHANYVHYDYNFASDGDSNKGVISFYDDRYASSVLQKTNQAANDWKRDGYSCYPEPPYDNTFNVRYNSSECAAAVLPPSELTVVSKKYFPFGTSAPYPCVSATTPTVYSRLSIQHRKPCSGYIGYTGNVLPGGSGFGCVNSGAENYIFVGTLDGMCNTYYASGTAILKTDAIQAWNEILATTADGDGEFSNDFICGELKLNGNGFRCFDKPKPPTTKELAIQRYASEYPPETICGPIKQNGPFRCKPKEKPPTTKEIAIERYASEYPPATICEPLKLNSPFQCARNVEVPATTRLSLSVAAAQAVFALTGIALVGLLRKLQKPSTTSSETLSTDGDLRSMMRKLRNEFHSTFDQLRTGQDQLRTGQDQLRVGQDQLRAGQGTHEELIQKLLSKEGGR